MSVQLIEESAEVATIRVIVAEDHDLVLEAIKGRLRLDAAIQIIASVTTGDELVAAYKEFRPDVVLTDIGMPGMSGIEATAAIRAVDPTARVLCLSGYDDRETIAQAVAAGASGFVVKTIHPQELCDVVHKVHHGESVFDQVATQALMAEVRHPSIGKAESTSSLSARELEILQYVAKDLTNGEIAQALFISPLTVKTHVERILAKLGVRGRVGAVREGIALGVVH
ncbi:MAG TPA: response regulator transcription factor [Acidimicrobiales bacterium]|nr:response regulator transcription factor [Acidimicrobiales bacterium]